VSHNARLLPFGASGDDEMSETIVMKAPTGAASIPDSATPGLIELALAVGGFAIGTGEFTIMGLLPDVAKDFQITEPHAGYVISSYALGVVVGSPIIAVLAAKLQRRTLLLGLMALFVLGNIASALAQGFWPLVGMRFLTGMPHGAYFGVAALVAAGMAPAHKRTQAVGRVMLGLTVATLIGTPAATWLGQVMGWRMAFALVGAIGAITVAMIFIFLPITNEKASSPLVELGALKRKQVWLTLGIAAVGSGGMFAVFSYVAPTLIKVSGIPESYVPFVLCVFGVGMILGNIIGAKLADRSLMGTIGGMLVYNGAIGLLFLVTAHNPWTATLTILLLGFNFAICPAVQTRLMDVAADAQTLAASLNHSAFNIANALGAWLGGVTIAAGYGWTSTGVVGAILACFGLVIFAISYGLDRAAKRVARVAPL
jgi:DHA1 family inner membrane transport protein